MLTTVEGLDVIGVEVVAVEVAEACCASAPLRNHDFQPPPLAFTLLFARSFQCCCGCENKNRSKERKEEKKRKKKKFEEKDEGLPV
jgi:hypothetical protein